MDAAPQQEMNREQKKKKCWLKRRLLAILRSPNTGRVLQLLGTLASVIGVLSGFPHVGVVLDCLLQCVALISACFRNASKSKERKRRDLEMEGLREQLGLLATNSAANAANMNQKLREMQVKLSELKPTLNPEQAQQVEAVEQGVESIAASARSIQSSTKGPAAGAGGPAPTNNP